MNIPPAALERCAKNGDPDCMFDFGNCLYDGICKGIGIKNKDLIKRPHYWGGFSFTPNYFEFWEANEFRLNKRKVFELNDGKWMSSILQP